MKEQNIDTLKEAVCITYIQLLGINCTLQTKYYILCDLRYLSI